MIVVQIALFALVAAAAVGVVLTRRPERQAFTYSIYGALLALLFLVLQAPDVALSEATVGGVAVPLVVLGTLAQIRSKR